MTAKSVHRGIIVICAIICFSAGLSASPFDHFFQDKTLRIDYFHIGTASEDMVALDDMYIIDGWAGPRASKMSALNLGHYMLRLYDAASGKLIYDYTYSTLFNEWQTTDAGISGQTGAIHETIRMPLPKAPIRVELWKRDKSNAFTIKFHEQEIDPASYHIRKEAPANDIQVFDHMINGPAADKVDIAFLAEGYQHHEAGKFLQDVKRMTDALFAVSPFKDRRGDFNIRALFKPSQESGTDDPREGIYRNTILNSSFNTFDSQRYLMLFDNRSIQNMRDAAPSDVVCVLINHDRYGGGGIFNLYASTTVDNEWSEFVFVHEFGHSFAALGDEYYTSQVAYNDFFQEGVEPWERNVAANIEKGSIKWKSYLSRKIALPSDWKKAEYDQMRRNHATHIADLRNANTPAEEVAAAIAANQQEVVDFFRNHKLRDKVGAFEGAGYADTGLFRPSLNCLMFTRVAETFDPVCHDALVEVIDYWSSDGANSL